jgi:hypothetical protein
VEIDLQKNRARSARDYTGKPMPPRGWGGGIPLSEEQKRTIVRWIDLGCPIDLDYDPKNPEKTGFGWMLDDQRPTLTVASPVPGTNAPLSRIVIGTHDYGSGLQVGTLRVTADFGIDGIAAGENLASRFKPASQGVWVWELAKPVANLKDGKLAVSIADRQGNITRIERSFSVSK